ncbi:Uncharacterised protein [Citrobacter koseri]|uniref:pEK499-p136 HEPN domain-containing protein n=1 Tax=Citrobacter koseri TaxID=545 RepID=A0A3S4IBL5_CITKO|nr:Uncharacterised protein [Citrobacter koseri]
MGNYSDFETDFVQRTLALIDHYNEMIEVLGKPIQGAVQLHVDPELPSGSYRVTEREGALFPACRPFNAAT